MDFLPSERIQARMAPLPTQAAVSQSQLIPVFQTRGRKRSLRQYLRCEYQGFFEPEILGSRRYVWLGAQGAIDCYFPQTANVQWIWLEISHTAPGGSVVQVRIDGERVMNDAEVEGVTTLAIRLPHVRSVGQLKIQIESDTFVPSRIISASDDHRELGIALRGVAIGRRRKDYRPRMDFRRTWPQRVREWVRQWKRSRRAA